jgi:hypothetical protein
MFESRRARACVRAAVALAVVVALGQRHVVAEGRPLPVFSVTAADGSLVSSAALGGSEPWLLIYASPQCVACERLLRALDDWAIARASGRTVVIVASEASSNAPANGSPTTGATSQSAVRSFSDSGGAAGLSLEVTDVPAVMGIRDGRIEWTVQGVLNDPAMLKGLLERWFGQ